VLDEDKVPIESKTYRRGDKEESSNLQAAPEQYNQTSVLAYKQTFERYQKKWASTIKPSIAYCVALGFGSPGYGYVWLWNTIVKENK
jgi:hypothetical protein